MRKSVILLMSVICIWTVTIAAQNKSTSNKSANFKPSSSPVADKEAIAEADRLFTGGDDQDRDQQALSTLEAVLTPGSKDYGLLWRSARAYYYVADFGEKDNKLALFEKGVEVAQRAIAVQPEGVEGHYWLAANYGGVGQLVGVLKALSTVKKIRHEMQTVLKLDESYDNGNAYLALGEIERELPSIMGGNKKRALGYFEAGLKIAPHNLDMKVALAKAYLAAKRKDEAHRLLQEVLQAAPANRIQREAQDDAKEILNQK